MEGHAIIYFPSSFRVFVLDEVLHTCARGLGFCSTDGVLYDVVLGQIMLLRIVIESEVGVARANRNSHPLTSVASTKMSDQFAALTNPTGSVATPNVASSAASKASNRLRVDIGKANSPDATNLFGLIICLPRDNFPGDLQRFAPGTMIKLPCRSMARNSALTDPDVVDPALPSGDAVRVAASRTVRAFVQFAEMVDVGEGSLEASRVRYPLEATRIRNRPGTAETSHADRIRVVRNEIRHLVCRRGAGDRP